MDSWQKWRKSAAFAVWHASCSIIGMSINGDMDVTANRTIAGSFAALMLSLIFLGCQAPSAAQAGPVLGGPLVIGTAP